MYSILKEHTILYVEDNPKVQREMGEYLKSYFGSVYTASDGKEGFEVYMCRFPDVLLLDIDLPEMDGLTLAKEIRKENRDIIILMLTAFTDREKLLKATELKLLKYLVKPIDIRDFEEAMDLVAKELLYIGSKHHHLREDYHWSDEKQELFYRDERVVLTNKEQKLLSLLIKSKGKVVTYEDIMAMVWEDEFEREVSINCVKNIVSNLRKKLPKDSISNIYARGYTLN